MAERSNVPKFGNWEGEENVPYTAYFEKARKVRAPGGGRVTNPNDPEYNSDSQSQATPPHPRTKPEEVDPVRRSRERMRSRDESELKQFGGDAAGGGSSNEAAANKRQGRSSQNNSYDNKSPLHKNSYDGTGRSRPKPNLRADESPEKVTVVPKFGDWDENNPASADGYTHIFNKVREERSSGANVSGSSRTPTHPSSRSNPSNTSKCCCFGFGGK